MRRDFLSSEAYRMTQVLITPSATQSRQSRLSTSTTGIDSVYDLPVLIVPAVKSFLFFFLLIMSRPVPARHVYIEGLL